MTSRCQLCLEPHEYQDASVQRDGSPTLFGKQTQFFFQKNWPHASLLARCRSASRFSNKCPKGRSKAELFAKTACVENPRQLPASISKGRVQHGTNVNQAAPKQQEVCYEYRCPFRIHPALLVPS